MDILLQEFNYEVTVKPGKANANADYLSRMRSPKAISDIMSPFPDEFPNEIPYKIPEQLPEEYPEEAPIFHISEREPSEFKDIIGYLTGEGYPTGMLREEKMVF